MDENGKPVEFASVRLTELDESRVTRRNGQFSFVVPGHFNSITLEVSFTNKKKEVITITRPFFGGLQKIVLENESLTLDGVAVNAVRKRANSASSIVFEEEAIRQMQAFSLMDILNNLPGKKTEAPDLQNPQTLTLRTNAAGTQAMNNSFGIAIFIDDVQITNDANMQSRSVGARGLGGSTVSGYQVGSFDVPYNGFDLRDIPLSNIERIEIIQGVASARYGNLSNGAILITTKAGRSPYTFTVNVNGGSTGANLSKGFDLGKKAGALNFNFGYTNSNADPRDKVKSYNNLSGGIKWSVNLSPMVRNSLSFSAGKNLDKVKTDPDDDSERSSYSRRENFSVANTTNIDFNKGILKNMDIGLSYNQGLQDTYAQWLLNSPPRPIGGKDTTGEYEGYFIPGNYLAVEHINGKPFSLSGRFNVDFKLFRTGRLRHSVSAGINADGSGNRGLGYIVDPERPRWLNVGGQNERPFRYEDSVKLLTSFSFYLQDNISGRLFNNAYRMALGFRYSLQNGYGAYQPRLSFHYDLTKNVSWSVSFGTSSKSPSLAHRYPAPVYFDVPLLNLYTGYTANSLYLVYTNKITNDNSYLEPASTTQLETGLQLKSRWGSGSVFGYYKVNKNGFATYADYIPFAVPVYRYDISPAGQINYYPAGIDSMVYNYSRNKIYNSLPDRDYGIEFMFQSNVIRLIRTYFNVRGSYVLSKQDADNNTFIEYKVNPVVENPKDIRYGVYTRPASKRSLVIITAASNTQIPRIGFIVTLSSDFTLMQKTNTEQHLGYPTGYLNSRQEFTPLTMEQAMQAEYSFLKRAATSTSANSNLPFPYANLNMRVAKEIRKQFRINFSIFNLLNIRPESYDPVADSYIRFNSPISFTLGASLQF